MNIREAALINDARILDAATYCKTKGMTCKATTEEIFQCFTELKHRIRIGSMTVEQLEDQVYRDWGIVREKDLSFKKPEDILLSILKSEQAIHEKEMAKKHTKGNTQTPPASNQNI